MTRAEIERYNNVYVADLLRKIMSVQIDERRPGVQRAINMRDGCPFQVVLDGIPLPDPVNLANLPSPTLLAGIEVYSGAATIPLQYKRPVSANRCGAAVILIWTKGA